MMRSSLKNIKHQVEILVGNKRYVQPTKKICPKNVFGKIKKKKGKGGTKKFGSGHYPKILNLKNWAGYVRIKKVNQM